MWLSVMNISIVNIAMPSIARDLGFDLSGIGWVVTGFFVTQAVLLPLAGRAGDLYGRRRVFVAGVAVLIAGSVLCALAWDPASLIVFRVVQAAGASAMAPTAISYVGELFSPRERGQALGILSAVVSIAPVVALNVAGGLVAGFGWRSVFWFTPIVGAAVLAGAVLLLPPLGGGRRRPFDLPGAALGGAGLFGVLIAVSRAEAWGVAAPATLASAAAGVVCLAGFVRHERRVPDPLLDLGLFRLRSVTAANAASGASAAALFGVLVLLPFYLARVLGFGPVELGLAISPIALSFMVVSPLAGRYVVRVGPARLATAGFAIAAAGAAAVAAAAAVESYGAIVPGVVLFGAGLAMASSPVTTSAISEAPREQLGVASSLPNISRYTGGAFGTAVLGVVMHAALPEGTERATGLAIPAVRETVVDGFRLALVGAVGFLLIAAFAAARLPRLTGVGRP
jgi:EmrB/QacA subfamily drug resistance transporter